MLSFGPGVIKKMGISPSDFILAEIPNLGSVTEEIGKNDIISGVMLKRAWLTIETTPDRYLYDIVKFETDVPHFLITMNGKIIQFMGLNKRFKGSDKTPLPKKFFIRIDLEGPRYYCNENIDSIQADRLIKLLKCIRSTNPQASFDSKFIQEYFWDYFCNWRDKGLYDDARVTDLTKHKEEVIVKIGKVNVTYANLAGSEVKKNLPGILQRDMWKRMLVNVAINSILNFKYILENAEIEKTYTAKEKSGKEVQRTEREKLSNRFKSFSSVLRLPHYNLSIGGAYNSQHSAGEALDTQYEYSKENPVISQATIYESIMRFIKSSKIGKTLRFNQAIYEAAEDKTFDEVLFKKQLWIHLGFAKVIKVEVNEEIKSKIIEIKNSVKKWVKEETERRFKEAIKNKKKKEKDKIRKEVESEKQSKFNEYMAKEFGEGGFTYKIEETDSYTVVSYGPSIIYIPKNVIESPVYREKIRNEISGTTVEEDLGIEPAIIEDRKFEINLLDKIQDYLDEKKKDRTLFSTLSEAEASSWKNFIAMKKGSSAVYDLKRLGITDNEEFYVALKTPREELVAIIALNNKNKNDNMVVAANVPSVNNTPPTTSATTPRVPVDNTVTMISATEEYMSPTEQIESSRMIAATEEYINFIEQIGSFSGTEVAAAQLAPPQVATEDEQESSEESIIAVAQEETGGTIDTTEMKADNPPVAIQLDEVYVTGQKDSIEADIVLRLYDFFKDKWV